MDNHTKKEIKGRTLKLDSQEQNKTQLDKLQLALTKIYTKEYEVINGVRRNITKTRRIAIGRALISEYASKDNLDITQDAINQLKLMDN